MHPEITLCANITASIIYKQIYQDYPFNSNNSMCAYNVVLRVCGLCFCMRVHDYKICPTTHHAGTKGKRMYSSYSFAS
jgi:hypothetical protein